MRQIAIILLICCVLAIDSHAADSLFGCWVKDHVQEIDNPHPGVSNLAIEVTFKADGRFFWQVIGQDGTNTIDGSFAGTYSLNNGMVNYRIDKPTAAARSLLPILVSFWPSKMKGQQSCRFSKDSLELGHDEAKLWFHMKRKLVEPTAAASPPVGRQKVDGQ